MSYTLRMNTEKHPQPKKKRGPAKRLPPMVDTHLFLPAELLEWAKVQPEGFAPLVRQLLITEQQCRTTELVTSP
jgi:hypothetical protein